MDQLVVSQKLESLRRCLCRVESKSPVSAKILSEDADLQDIIVLNLSRAIQLCVDIASHIIVDTELPSPTTMGESFELLVKAGAIDTQTASKLRKAVGFRNIAVHNYEQINWDIVHAIASQGLGDFKQFVKQISLYSGL